MTASHPLLMVKYRTPMLSVVIPSGVLRHALVPVYAVAGLVAYMDIKLPDGPPQPDGPGPSNVVT